MTSGTLHFAIKLEEWNSTDGNLPLRLVFWQGTFGLDMKLWQVSNIDQNSTSWQEVTVDLTVFDWEAASIDGTKLGSVALYSWELVRFAIDEIYITY